MLSKEASAINAELALTSDPTVRGWRALHAVIVLTSSAAVTGRGEESARWFQRKKKEKKPKPNVEPPPAVCSEQVVHFPSHSRKPFRG